MNKNPVLGIAIFIFVIVGLIVGNKALHTRAVSAILSSDEQILNTVVDAAVDGKTTVTFRSSVCPSESVMDNIFPRVLEKDAYIGAELHHYTYRYTMSGAYYKVKVKLSKPSKLAAYFSRIRARQIAKNLNAKLDNDYDKVKAVHDYLIQINKYSYLHGGAFNCMYLRSSACNGYAGAFYVIMKELGIPATCEFGSNHEWNRVYVDGHWYNMDLTWDDQNHRVVYDYFLKNDNDWVGHEHGGSDAPKSLEATGRMPSENFKLIPSYRTFANLGGIAFVVAMFFAFRLIRVIANKRELAKIEKQLRREEEARRIFEAELEAKRKAFSEEDHNLY